MCVKTSFADGIIKKYVPYLLIRETQTTRSEQKMGPQRDKMVFGVSEQSGTKTSLLKLQGLARKMKFHL